MGLNIEIPNELSHLKKDERGYPIPFFVPIIDGKPNFKFLSEQKKKECMEKRLCGVCGKKLYKDYHYFLSGPLGLKNTISADPPMHRVCAEFAVKACPHLYLQPAQRKAGKSTIIDWFIIEDKPEIIVMAKSNKFTKVIDPVTKQWLFRYNPVAVTTFMYKNGVLTFFSEEPYKPETK
jgi:hypothetical protein